jgi:hypothetical protein
MEQEASIIAGRRPDENLNLLDDLTTGGDVFIASCSLQRWNIITNRMMIQTE